MTPEARRALVESIAHWERMRDDINCGEQPSCGDCPLCHLYLEEDCVGCPIEEDTYKWMCRGTPYHEAADWYYKDDRNEDGYLLRWQHLAQQEIDYLTDLLRREGDKCAQWAK